MNNSLTALFGGTFDPIHYGHLLPVIALLKEVGLSHISLLPNHTPPHKPQPEASTSQRIKMLKLAIENLPMLSLDLREILQAQLHRPSYTIETLQAWRNENGFQQGLAFILGQDCLLHLPTWYNWQALLDYCHLIICRRPGYEPKIEDQQLKAWIKQNSTLDIKDLHQNKNGLIYFANTPLQDISATEIRKKIIQKQPYQSLLPPKVWQYIQSQQLYGA